ncbi:MAG: DUF2075 domain-containing protein [Xanthobacteraceae bacterium]
MRVSPVAVLGELVAHHTFAVDQNQRNAWQAEITHLQEIANDLPDSFVFLEFAIPRMGKRADAIIISGGHVFVIEYKVGADDYQKHAIDQVLDYALDLKNFHEGSHNLTIVPIVVATNAPARQLELQAWADDVMRPVLTNRDTLLPTIGAIRVNLKSQAVEAGAWAASPYKPTPTIVEAAQALYRGHDVREISRSEAGAENLSRTGVYIAEVIEAAKRSGEKAICFVTGVPGSGKTLAGLNIATERMRSSRDEHAVFLSGNGPLVAVLREALAIDEVDRSKTTEAKSVSKKDAYRHASAFIQNIHHFRDEYAHTALAPTERVVVFDEAQRAWNREQASRFMRDKRGHGDFDMSEPQFLMSVMDRHKDWCVVACLIGGGQEINTGEAGLEEWLSAIEHNYPDWQVHLSDRLTRSDYFGGSHVPVSLERLDAVLSPALHLAISVRSFRAEVLSDFVGAVVGGEAKLALSLHRELTNYPLVITRKLEAVRDWLRQHARGSERTGLVASSNSMRLKPIGIHVKAHIDPPLWFLADKTDVRSSFALEDVATEFDIQGLELDWVGMCWDANFRREGNKWNHYSFRGARWERINDPIRATYLVNAYRVLLTRARQGMVIYVPFGSEIDDTRKPSFYDGTYAFLCDCGVTELT